MAIPRTKQQVLQDAEGIWLCAVLAVARSGLAWRELREKAWAGEIRHQGENRTGDPLWFHEEDITAIARAQPAKQAELPAKPKRKQTDAQLEAMHTRIWKNEAKTRRQSKPTGGVSAHAERVLLSNLKKPEKP